MELFYHENFLVNLTTRFFIVVDKIDECMGKKAGYFKLEIRFPFDCLQRRRTILFHYRLFPASHRS